MTPAPISPTRIVARSPFWWAVSKGLVLAFTKVWCRLRVEGRANVPATGPVLLVANHASYLDPPLVGITTRRWVAFLAQAGLARLGPVRWWLRQMGVTLIDRRAPSKEALRLIADCLARGEAVGLFPEGTRSADGSIAPFKNGVEFLVRRTGASVVPIGLDGASRAFPRGAIFPRPRKLIVRYGEVWPAERVLAPGGIAALRARVAELANAPLAEPAAAAGSSRIPDQPEAGRSEPGVQPIAVDPGPKSSAPGEA
ncbi:MAG: lysophospholipid acyltransferase family protein [Phycisphaerales bacterium]